jgi:hypothetical protein
VTHFVVKLMYTLVWLQDREVSEEGDTEHIIQILRYVTSPCRADPGSAATKQQVGPNPQLKPPPLARIELHHGHPHTTSEHIYVPGGT